MRDEIGRLTALLLGLLILAACAGPAAAPAPTSAPPPTNTLEPAPPVAAKPSAAAVNPTAIAQLTVAAPTAAPEADPGFHRTDDGYYIRGRANAPVVIEDYSDFL